MTEPIDIEASLEGLERDLQSWLATLPGDMPHVAAEALDRMGIRPGRPRQWTRRLSPLVVLYPELQAQAVGNVGTKTLRDLGLAHLQLVVHAFLSDRQLDGQLVLTPEECVLSTQALLAASAALDFHATDGQESRDSTLALLRSHHGAQLASYPVVDSHTLDDELEVFRIVADRALPAWLAPRVLVASSSELARRAKEAFDHLFVGLQWTDDLVDWSHDLDRGQQNLLLRRLRLPLAEVVTVRDVELESRLIGEGVYSGAFASIDRHLARAKEIQEQLGAVQLAQLVAGLSIEMGGLRENLDRLVHQRTSGSDPGNRSFG